MNKFKVSKIGEFHLNHNEDSMSIIDIGENKIMIAVMDGCSMGKESHFASTLIAKVLRKIGKEISYRAFIEKNEKDSNEYLKEILAILFKELKKIKHQLMLEREELLSTLILGILDQKKKEMELIAIGDGLICCNGTLYEFEQEDKPDYLGYHLAEDFNSWFLKQTQRLQLKNIVDLSFSTDGIFTFKKFDNNTYEAIEENEIIHYLLIDQKWKNQENMLSKKLTEIEKRFGLKPSDDLTILRVITTDNNS